MIKTILINQDPPVAIQARKKLEEFSFTEITHQISDLKCGLAISQREVADLMILCCHTLNLEKIELLKKHLLHQPIALLIFSREIKDELIPLAIDSGITSFVIDGFEPERLDHLIHISLARFIKQRRTENELLKMSTSLKSHRTLERAKNRVMRTRNLNEDEAYQTLRETALRENQPIETVAAQILGGIRSTIS